MRSLVFELLSVLILPLIFGIDGIWSAISVAEIMAFIMSMLFMLNTKRSIIIDVTGTIDIYIINAAYVINDKCSLY